MKAKTTLPSSGKTSRTSSERWHATKKLLIDVDNLTVDFGGQPAVHKASLCMHRGEFIGLIGPNGAGKTTLLKAILGLTNPSHGHIHLHAAKVAYVPQAGRLYSGIVPISVLEVARMGAANYQQALEALAQVGMEKLARNRFNELSGGQQQRVIIAKALAERADLLILDEPVTGVDDQTQKEFYKLLQSLQGEGITVVMVSHEVEAVLKLVTRVVFLNQTVLYDGPPSKFDPQKYLSQEYQDQHQKLHHGDTHA
jgi:ABC-type Mn2+/Zn2+ transport system ATPase subunit